MSKGQVEFLGKPESETLEYKLQIPNSQLTARLLSAFANTKGGQLVIGVNDEGLPIGVTNAEVIRERIQQSAELISPKIAHKVEIIEVDHKPLVVTTVEKGINAIYKVNDDTYRRIGERIVKSDPSLAGLDVHNSSIQAITSGAVAVGAGSIAVGERGVIVGGDISGEIITGDQNITVSKSVQNAKVVDFDTAFERLAGSTTFVIEQLGISYEQTREQSAGWFKFSVSAAVLGFVLIAIGAIIAIIGQTTAAIITAVAGIIPEVAAALFFVQAKSANERVDTILAQLGEAREILTSVEIANTIEDEKVRNSLKAEIVRKALQISSANSA